MKWYRTANPATAPQTYGPLYHGSKVKGLKEFDPAFEGTGIVSPGVPKKDFYGGFFFTSDKDAARYYANPGENDPIDAFVVTAYVTMNNPYVVENPELSPKHYITQAKLIAQRFDEEPSIYGDDASGWYYLVSNEEDPDPNNVLNKGPFHTEEEAMVEGNRAMQQHNQQAVAEPYDGVILKSIVDGDLGIVSDIYVPFDAGQIKIVN